jgi:hypothetical protein
MSEIRKALKTLVAVKGGGLRGVSIRRSGQQDDMLTVSCSHMDHSSNAKGMQWKLGVSYSFTDDAKKTVKRLGVSIPVDWHARQQEGLGISYTPEKSGEEEIANVIYDLLTKLYQIDQSEKLSFKHENF